MPAETMAQERARERYKKPLKPSYYLQQRQQEYRTFGRHYMKPVLETGMAVFVEEREKEEAALRKSWEGEVATAEEEAVEMFEESLEAAKQEALAGEFVAVEPGLTPGRHQLREEPEFTTVYPTQEEMATWERQERKKFTESLEEWRSSQEAVYQAYIQDWRTQWRPKGLAERMMEWTTPTTPLDWLRGVKTPTKAPLAPWAGMVASVESFVYGVAGLAGLRTPRPVPTAVGSVISQYVFGRPEEREALREYPKEYVGGTLIGDFILGYAVGKGIEKVVTPVLSPLTQRVEEVWRFSRPAKALYQAKLWRIEHLPTWRGSTLDIMLAKKVPWYYRATGGLARAEVSMGVIGKTSYEMLPSAWMAGEAAWAIHMTPRTGGVMIAGGVAGVTPKKPVFVAFAKYGVAGYIGVGEPMFTKEELQEIQLARWGVKRAPTIPEMRERGLLPFVTQTQVTRAGVLPYIPSPVPSRAAVSGILPSLLGTTLLTVARAPKFEQFESLRLGILEAEKVQKPKKKEKIVPRPGLAEWILEEQVPVSGLAEEAIVAPKVAEVQVQEPSQVTRQILLTGYPSILKARPSPVIPRRPPERKKKKKRLKPGRKRLKWERYQMVYPVTGVSEVAKHILS